MLYSLIDVYSIFPKFKNKDDILIIRFMGTSRGSASMKLIMNSIIKQIDIIYENMKRDDESTAERTIDELNELQDDDDDNNSSTIENDDREERDKTKSSSSNSGSDTDSGDVEITDGFFYESITEVKKRFMNKLSLISTRLNSNEKLIIFLDSIDQLSAQDYDLEWMIYELPKSVKIVYSVLPNYPLNKKYSIISKLSQSLEYNKNSYLEINELDSETSKSIINKWFQNANRQLTQSQWIKVNEIINTQHSIYPLHLKILFDIVSKWSSGQSHRDCQR